jgi:hypothetical protein
MSATQAAGCDDGLGSFVARSRPVPDLVIHSTTLVLPRRANRASLKASLDTAQNRLPLKTRSRRAHLAAPIMPGMREARSTTYTAVMRPRRVDDHQRSTSRAQNESAAVVRIAAIQAYASTHSSARSYRRMADERQGLSLPRGIFAYPVASTDGRTLSQPGRSVMAEDGERWRRLATKLWMGGVPQLSVAAKNGPRKI